MKKKIILIIPAYNEEKNILKVCNSIKKHNKENEIKYDIIVINDGSTDNTKLILDDNKINHIDLIHNLGIGGAVQTGYKYASQNDYDIAVQFDGDGQHNIYYVDKIIKPILDEKTDMVIGSRFIEKINTFKSSGARRIGIKIISYFIRLVTKRKIYDTTSGMRAVNKKLITEFSKNYPTEYPEPISTTIILKKGYIVKEVSVEMNERKRGKSSITNWKSCYYMINVVLYILVVGLRRYRK